MARPVHTLDLEARTLTSQKFNGIRELVTILHRVIRVQIDQVYRAIYLFRLVLVEEAIHIYLHCNLNSLRRTRNRTNGPLNLVLI